MVELFANSRDPDQMLHSATSYLGPYCLPNTLFKGFPDYNGLKHIYAVKRLLKVI